jgi:DNA-binding CsgD family transcriptional regulator
MQHNDNTPLTNSKCKDHSQLTERQLEYAYWLLKGCTLSSIAKHLNVSYRTAESTIKVIKTKLKCKTREDLTSELIKIPTLLIKLLQFQD